MRGLNIKRDLSADFVRSILNYDPTSGVFTWAARTAHCVQIGARAGCKNSYGYIAIRIMRKTYVSHRLAWLVTYGEWPKYLIDHIDGDKLNNRIENLREATASQNVFSTFGKAVKGYCLRGGKYQALIMVDRKQKSLGRFPTEQLAREAYLAAATKYFGDFSAVHHRRNHLGQGQ